jgi:aquaporin Z
MLGALTNHWPEYLMEGAELAVLMALVCCFATLLEYPASPLHEALTNVAVRRTLMGVAMAVTVVAIIYSPWGRQSGAHFNPAVTLTFFRLGKVEPWDAGFYVGAHFVGGAIGVLVAAAALGRWLASPPVNYAVTTPVPGGPAAAFAGEFATSFIFMTVVLVAINAPRLERFTGLLVGVMVAAFILVETPLSGMSINPARTLASAVPARVWTGLWVYFAAPPAGMLLAAEAYLRVSGRSVRTAKLRHDDGKRCIFRCDHHAGVPLAVEGGRYASRAAL